MPLNGAPNSEPDHKLSHTEFAVRVLIALAIATVLVLFLWLIGRALQVFLVLFAAVLFAVLLRNLSRHVHQLTRLPYKWALPLVLLLLFGILIGGAFLLAPGLTEQGKQMAETLPKALQNLTGKVRQLPFGEQIMKGLPDPESLLKEGGGALQRALGFFSTTLGALANIFIIMVVGIYLASSPHQSTEGFLGLIPIRKRARAREVMYTLGYTLWGWLKGTLLAMLIIGTVTSIGLTIIGVPLPLVLGVIAGVFEFVPNIGPFVAGAPAVLLALLEGSDKALYVILLFALVQGLEGWVLTPLVQKKVIDLPPVLTLSAQLLLGMLAGFAGLILAVPLMAVAMVLVKMLYIEDVLGDHDVEVKGEEEAKENIQQRKTNGNPEEES